MPGNQTKPDVRIGYRLYCVTLFNITPVPPISPTQLFPEVYLGMLVRLESLA
jgi:hypothetical protein